MLIVEATAFVEDAFSAWLLYQGSKSSLNVKSAFIHMVGDTLATVGVIVGGLLVMAYIYWIDPAITLAIAVYIGVHSYIEIRKAIHILMESAPEGFDFDRMIQTIEGLDGVHGLHHLHLWQLDEQRVALEAHVVVNENILATIEQIKHHIKSRLRDDFGIGHATLEIEREGVTGHDPSVIWKHE